MRYGLLIALLCASAFAQQYDLSGLIGYGAYRDHSISSPTGTLTVGMRNTYAAGGLFGQDLYSHISGEVRYLYQNGDPFVSSGSVRGYLPGHSQTFSYDGLFHVYDRDRRFRPFAAVGVGGKVYQISGSAPFPPSPPQLAQFTKVNDWQYVFDVGAGFKYRLSGHVMLRGDFRDYISPFPKKLYAPAGNGSGWLQQFTPTLGLGYWF